MDFEQIPVDKRKVLELYRQLMNVLERNSAKTEEAFVALTTGIKTIVENDAIPLQDRRALKRKVVDAMEAEYIGGGPTLITPGMTH